MFFIARAQPAMFTGSCGSYRTTFTAESREAPSRKSRFVVEYSVLSRLKKTRPQLRCVMALGPAKCRHSGDWTTCDETINDHDHGDHEEQVYETATDMYYEEAQNPEDEQNHRDRPQHVFVLEKG